MTDLDIVTDEAVRCRNFYVHGTPGSFSYAEHGGVFTFLTGALEFIFAAADLVEAGWDIRKWRGHAACSPIRSTGCCTSGISRSR
ncbi:hypothetical protein [Sphingomonas sp. CFBP 8760]|uniref:hypothetical protein n=1 Tax=Sphingomonas sp. CFBP 8760 TaxID=2775282 RepID=UPI00177DA736|nr:hypothetical protein [Sphingomonas sp. CFBP 8760]MBD8547476.1 hypothetical protein [Sphingomonas sp. CFBP 8760]